MALVLFCRPGVFLNGIDVCPAGVVTRLHAERVRRVRHGKRTDASRCACCADGEKVAVVVFSIHSHVQVADVYPTK
jgi:hypothetical protein